MNSFAQPLQSNAPLINRDRLWQSLMDLAGLYRDDVYPAWNWFGFIAFGVPVALTLLSLGSNAFSWFYDYGWFTGSVLGGLIYYGLCSMRPSPSVAKSPV